MLARAAVLVVCLSLAALSAEAQRKQKNDHNLIAAEDIARASVNDGYQAVEKLRSHWLRRAQLQRSISSQRGGSVDNADPAMGMLAGSLVVFVDGNEMGSVRELERITSDQIAEMRDLSGPDAQIQYGPRFGSGVIQVKLKTS